MKTIRPRDASEIYAHPRAQLVRLSERGLLHRVADGYYVVVPQDMVGRNWTPGLEATAAGIASAIYGPEEIVVMGPSAARLHGAIPRALAVATIAVPRKHRETELSDRPAVVHFVKRDTARLDAELIEAPLGTALVTTPEQTVLDLAHRPRLGDVEVDVRSAVATLHARSDQQRLTMLATDQRKMASLRRARGLGPDVNGDELDLVAAQFGVSTEQVERDHLISHVLAFLSATVRDRVHFIGGTALARTHAAGRQRHREPSRTAVNFVELMTEFIELGMSTCEAIASESRQTWTRATDGAPRIHRERPVGW